MSDDTATGESASDVGPHSKGVTGASARALSQLLRTAPLLSTSESSELSAPTDALKVGDPSSVLSSSPMPLAVPAVSDERGAASSIVVAAGNADAARTALSNIVPAETMLASDSVGGGPAAAAEAASRPTIVSGPAIDKVADGAPSALPLVGNPIEVPGNHASFAEAHSSPALGSSSAGEAHDHAGLALGNPTGLHLATILDTLNPGNSNPQAAGSAHDEPANASSLLGHVLGARPNSGAPHANIAAETARGGSAETNSAGASAGPSNAMATSTGAPLVDGIVPLAHSSPSAVPADVVGSSAPDATNKASSPGSAAMASMIESGAKAILLNTHDRSAADAGTGGSFATPKTAPANQPAMAAPNFTPEILSARDQLASAIATASPEAAAITTLPAQAATGAIVPMLGADAHVSHSHGG